MQYNEKAEKSSKRAPLCIFISNFFRFRTFGMLHTNHPDWCSKILKEC